ncbi:recombinase family protein [Paeniroseomonas aquatica]|uniref:Recombinase family protein n=1 Tax=Paeniroseomonas aquatica TaxID=373043 RepID=A0ABT8A8L5_9PROT|nr:recombinase family protein [Paeniroseomonas aquatica]MDN3566015.1 recombinase family protein [Paeniroseomonas aquatica]
MPSYVAYLRVSTAGQGRSGLGIEAQQTAIDAYIRPGDHLLQPPYVEVESGRKADRPQLAAAIERCKRTGATLLVAKLDRLSRNAAFLLNLRDAGVEFVCADMPGANRLTVGIMALVAEEEARMISARTKAALAAAKIRRAAAGLPGLGGDRGYRPKHRPDVAKASRARTQAANHAAHRVLPVIRELQASGLSLRGIAAELAKRGIPTPRGGAWTAAQVSRSIQRTTETA